MVVFALQKLKNILNSKKTRIGCICFNNTGLVRIHFIPAYRKSKNSGIYHFNLEIRLIPDLTLL